jgi:hypothetical protein
LVAVTTTLPALHINHAVHGDHSACKGLDKEKRQETAKGSTTRMAGHASNAFLKRTSDVF